MRIAGLCGSLREGSTNRALLRTAADVLPAPHTLDVLDISELPLFNEDIETRGGDPQPVARLKDAVRSADAVLFATPEYNWGTPGVLKNAIDWLSRPYATNALKEKPVTLMGASEGPWGTVRSQLQLRQTLGYLGAFVLPQPSVFVAMAREKVDKDGRLTDDRARGQIEKLLAALIRWAERVRE